MKMRATGLFALQNLESDRRTSSMVGNLNLPRDIFSSFQDRQISTYPMASFPDFKTGKSQPAQRHLFQLSG